MITIHELLRDKTYREYFCKVPKLPEHMTHGHNQPWRLAVQKEAHGPWGTKEFQSYPDAFKLLKKNLSRINDAAIISKGVPLDPPRKTVRIKGKFLERGGKKIPVTKRVDWTFPLGVGEDQLHTWCPYCRRPTVFARFTYHPVLNSRRMGGLLIDPDLMRCSICGASERIVNIR